MRASSGEVLATLVNNGLNQPRSAAFDGERVLVTNQGNNTVALWKATDLTPLGVGQVGAGTTPFGVCSDGQSFWITLLDVEKLARF